MAKGICPVCGNADIRRSERASLVWFNCPHCDHEWELDGGGNPINIRDNNDYDDELDSYDEHQ